MNTDIRLLVIGCGSIGERHIHNLRALGATEVAAFDLDAERLERVARDCEIRTCGAIHEGLSHRPDAVLVCTPPYLHTSIVQQALLADAHVFVEKPLAHTLDGLDALLIEAGRRRRVVQVGYQLRFHPGLQQLRDLIVRGSIGRPLVARAEFGQYLPDWRPRQDYRCSYTARAAMGGGIILDASHEIDYVRWLLGEVKSVYCAADHLSSLEVDVEDTASLILRLRDGAIAEVHLDCVQRGYARSCKVIGDAGTVVWDYGIGLSLLAGSNPEWQAFPVTTEPNQMYLDEMRHFLECVRGEAEPLVDGATGRRVLEIALAAKRSVQEGRSVRV
jgi:predicted dehydrogenase